MRRWGGYLLDEKEETINGALLAPKDYKIARALFLAKGALVRFEELDKAHGRPLSQENRWMTISRIKEQTDMKIQNIHGRGYRLLPYHL